MDGFPNQKKRQKALHALCLSKSWRPIKCCPPAFHSYKLLSFNHDTGCLDVASCKNRTHPVLCGTLLFSVGDAFDFRKKIKKYGISWQRSEEAIISIFDTGLCRTSVLCKSLLIFAGCFLLRHAGAEDS